MSGIIKVKDCLMISYDNWNQKSRETADFLERVQKEIRSIVPEAEIILYGSRARGDAGQVSDWDFLVLVDQPVDRSLTEKIRNHLYDLELETDTIVSSIIRSREEWYSTKYSVLPLKVVVENEGVLL